MFFADAPAEAMLGTVAGDPNTGAGTWTMRMWTDADHGEPGCRRDGGLGVLQRDGGCAPHAHP